MNPFSVLEYAQANISIPSSLLRRKSGTTSSNKEQQQHQPPLQKTTVRQPQQGPSPFRRSSPLAPHSQPPSSHDLLPPRATSNNNNITPGRPPHTIMMQRTLSSTSIDRCQQHSSGSSSPVPRNNNHRALLRRQSSSSATTTHHHHPHHSIRDDGGTGSLPRQSSSARASMDGRYLRPSLKDITMAFASSSSSSPSSPADALKPRSFSASAASSETRWNARFHKKTPSSTSMTSWLSTPPMPAVVAAVAGVVTGASHATSSNDVPPVVDDDLMLPPPVAIKRTNSSSSSASTVSAKVSSTFPASTSASLTSSSLSSSAFKHASSCHNRTSSSSSLSSNHATTSSPATGVSSSTMASSATLATADVAAHTASTCTSSSTGAQAATTKTAVEPITAVPLSSPASPPTAADIKPASSPSLFGRIPRPSPLGPLRAARRVVSSVTQAGISTVTQAASNTGLLPSKDQLEAIPVAGRILKHPVMDSTINYLASKAIPLGGLNQRDQRRLFDPHHDGSPLTAEDEHYRKLNRRLVEQSMTLSVLALEKEALSKTGEDEAGDEAFELYLAAIATLMHALPIETCDPLRREAFENQLKSFLAACEQYSQNVGRLFDDRELAKQRRRRRRRHRHHREQASYLIQHTLQANEQAAVAAQAAQAAEARRLTTRLSNIINPRRYFGGSASAAQPASAATSAGPASPIPAPAPTTVPYRTSGSISSASAAGKTPRSGAGSRHHTQNTKTSSPNRMSRRRRRGVQREARKGLSDKIVSTAVDSAIRLKQSRIPDAVGAAVRASRFVFGKVDERFHLQEKAWNLSKQGVEKAIELDQQYAIHEMVAETFFATVTGLVKAGIAYKETPGYADLRQLERQEKHMLQQGEGAGEAFKTSMESEMQQQQQQSQPVTRSLLSTIAAAASEVNSGVKRRVNNPQTIVSSDQMNMANHGDDGDVGSSRRHSRYEEEYSSEEESEDSEESDGYDSEVTNSSESSYNDDEADEDHLRATTELAGREIVGVKDDTEDDETSVSSEDKDGGLAGPYTEQVRQKIDLFMSLKGAASLLIGNL